TALAERYRSLQALANERYKTASRPPMTSSGLTPEEAEKQLEENQEDFEASQNKVDALCSGLNAAEQRRPEAERQARIARETHTQLGAQEADQQTALATAESRKSSAEINLASLTSVFERLTAERANSSDSTQDIEQEIESQESALHEVQSVLRTTVADKEASVASAPALRDTAKKAEANVNSLKEELSAACARVEVLEQSLQPAS